MEVVAATGTSFEAKPVEDGFEDVLIEMRDTERDVKWRLEEEEEEEDEEDVVDGKGDYFLCRGTQIYSAAGRKCWQKQGDKIVCFPGSRIAKVRATPFQFSV